MTSPRYLALAGDDDEHLERWRLRHCTAHGLRVAYRTHGLIVFANDPLAVVRLGEQGCIIGTLFHRHGPPSPIDELDDGAATEIIVSQGTHLIERYWGSYIALWPSTKNLVALRAPIGTLPCLYADAHGLVAIASDVDLLDSAELIDMGIDWTRMAQYLYLRDLPSEATVLEGVRELPPGARIRLGAQTEAEAEHLWLPQNYAKSEPQSYDEPLGDRFHRVIHNCIVSLAASSPRIVATVSGGLDSSIVVSCLSRCRAQVAAVTLATDDPSGDERAYARATCNHLGIELTEARYQLCDVDLDFSISSHRAFPSGRIHEQALRKAVARVVGKHEADCVFSGNGGDNVFYNSASVRPVIDRFIMEGLFASLVTLRDISTLTGASFLEVLREIAKLVTTGGKAVSWIPDGTMLRGDLNFDELNAAAGHQWLRSNGPTMLPAKVGHTKMLLRMLHHIEGYGPSVPFTVLNPLTSQPIVEFCLGLPSWLFCNQGINRSIVRRSFQSRLP
ncbi:MAG: asparagine synthase-related protein, partial [Sphingobium sp.]